MALAEPKRCRREREAGYKGQIGVATFWLKSERHRGKEPGMEIWALNVGRPQSSFVGMFNYP